ncbi:MAG: sensor histidine kinase [Pseudomonadota bacterium]
MTDEAIIRGSLARRLAVTLVGGAAILSIFLFVIARNYAAEIAQQSQDRILEASVTSILDVATVRDGRVEIDLPYASFSMLNSSADDRVFYAIYKGSDFMTGYPELKFDASAQVATPVISTQKFQGANVRRVLKSRTFSNHPDPVILTVIVAQTQDAMIEVRQQISRNAAIFGIGFFLLAAGLSFWAISATIKPLRRLALSVGRRGPRDLRPVSQPVPTELSGLVSAFNSLMARFDRSLEQSENFIAEAAHRIRTPLATVRSHAESTLQRVDKDDNRQALRSMIRALDESSRAAGQILDHAMVTFRKDQLESETIDLTAITSDIVERLLPVAEMKDVDIKLTEPEPVPFSGDPILIQNAVRNLIDNALKYSPSETTVEVAVSSKPSPNITVIDEGPGFPVDELDTLSNRFSRGSNAEGTIGSGLGLTIARDVVEIYDGKLILRNRKEGGACVIFSL